MFNRSQRWSVKRRSQRYRTFHVTIKQYIYELSDRVRSSPAALRSQKHYDRKKGEIVGLEYFILSQIGLV